MGCRSTADPMHGIEESSRKMRQLAVCLRDVRAVDDAPVLLTILLPPHADVKAWEQKLGHRPQSRTSDEGEHMQNLSRTSDHWQQFEGVAAAAQRLFRQVIREHGGKLPSKGVVMFVGSADRRQDVAFEPPSAVQAPVHLCDAKFHVEYLSAFSCRHVYGFLVVDGNGCLCGTLSGHEKQVRDKFSVDLPNKHGRGGQSALRFARLRLEKRHNYMTKVAERAAKCFITGEAANVSGLIIAGAAEFKSELTSGCFLDPRLQDIRVATLDVAYGGEAGFHQAINLSGDVLQGLEFVREKQAISRFLGEVARGRGMCCFGPQDTMAALEMGAVETLILWEDVRVNRVVVVNEATDAQEVVFEEPQAARGAELRVVESARLVDWIVDNHASFGAALEFVTDRSQEGSQFCRGFGGIGGVLRFGVSLEAHSEPEGDATDSDSDFADS